MSETLEKEIKKLEVRISNLIEESKMLIKDLKELEKQILKLYEKAGKIEEVEEVMETRVKSAEKLRDVINGFGRIEHIFSHILESYGEIILTLEKELQKIKYQ